MMYTELIKNVLMKLCGLEQIIQMKVLSFSPSVSVFALSSFIGSLERIPFLPNYTIMSRGLAFLVPARGRVTR